MGNENSHYEALGVPREASTDQIKAAFRRMARKHHPDKNPGDEGATERYQRIQRAYDVLSDPELRANYDVTGSDKPLPPLDLRARDVMLQIWKHYVMNGNPGVKPMPFMRETLTASIDNVQKMLKRFDQVAGHRGKLRVKPDAGENLFECVLDQMQRDAEAQRPKYQADLDALKRAREMLDQYESTEAPGWMNYSAFSAGTSTTL